MAGGWERGKEEQRAGGSIVSGHPHKETQASPPGSEYYSAMICGYWHLSVLFPPSLPSLLSCPSPHSLPFLPLLFPSHCSGPSLLCSSFPPSLPPSLPSSLPPFSLSLPPSLPYLMCQLVCYHHGNPLLADLRVFLRVVENGRLPVSDESPVLHGTGRKVWDGKQIWRTGKEVCGEEEKRCV